MKFCKWNIISELELDGRLQRQRVFDQLYVDGCYQRWRHGNGSMCQLQHTASSESHGTQTTYELVSWLSGWIEACRLQCRGMQRDKTTTQVRRIFCNNRFHDSYPHPSGTTVVPRWISISIKTVHYNIISRSWHPRLQSRESGAQSVYFVADIYSIPSFCVKTTLRQC